MSAQLERRALAVDDLYNAEDEERRLLFITSAMYRRILADMHLLVADALNLDPATFRLPDSATTALLGEAASRVVAISASTREAIAARLQAGQEAGLTTQEIAATIEHLFDVTWKNRAANITDTEIVHAQLESAKNRYRASGLVDTVGIIDAQRGTEHEAICVARNGTTISLDDADGLQMAHPLCSLLIVPHVRGEAS